MMEYLKEKRSDTGRPGAGDIAFAFLHYSEKHGACPLLLRALNPKDYSKR